MKVVLRWLLSGRSHWRVCAVIVAAGIASAGGAGFMLAVSSPKQADVFSWLWWRPMMLALGLNTPVCCGLMIWIWNGYQRKSDELQKKKAEILSGYMNELRDKENEFLSLFFHNPDSIMAFDHAARILHMNPAAQRLLNYSLSELRRMGTGVLAAIAPESDTASLFAKVLSGGVLVFDSTLRRKDGQMVYVQATAIPIYQDGQVRGVYIVCRDVTQQREAERRIRMLADLDHLTGRFNRRYFSEQLEQALVAAAQGGPKPAVLFVDIDRFKQINDALGHDAGDHVLKTAAERMAACIDQGDVLARFGGDEFAVLLRDVQMEDATHVAEKILQVLEQPVTFDGNELYLTASVGIAVYPVGGDTAAALLRHADAAMYEAKRKGKNRYQVHTPSMQAQAYAFKTNKLEHDLRRSICSGGSLKREYPPEEEERSGRVVAAETFSGGRVE
ncbi:sensor domain-containing diguanylate cyclase [Alicyclobacillus cellulosilyticus]|uniref:sensor domain-containing diguanylate cyclase n=1 Tax=Alicyclobacillus cellulosilyticus TaxID=1003997 RepID=UPI00166AA859|nr:sensor domain-containing diguanylate cyclase [Alicyclobacillus cellulosilyticus]